MSPLYDIRRDYFPAAHHSGDREAPCIAYFVVHTGELDDLERGAEKMGAWFQNPSSRGSTHYGVDNNSIQQYLADSTECWGAPPLNDSGIHMEFSGRAAWTRAKWLSQAKPMLDRGAWLIAQKCKQHHIPVVLITNSQTLAKLGSKPSTPKGITTHNTVTLAWHETSHTDPGAGFPLDYLMERVRYYYSGGTGVADKTYCWLKAHTEELGEDGKPTADYQAFLADFKAVCAKHGKAVVWESTSWLSSREMPRKV